MQRVDNTLLVVTSISVRIESAAPFTGRLLGVACVRPRLRSRFADQYGGCGGGDYFDERVRASFSGTDPAGTTSPAALRFSGQTYAEDPNLPAYGALPVSIGPGHSISFGVELAISAPSATYAFSVGVSLDGAAPRFSQPTSPILLAPVAQTWTGAACQSSEMQAQIPPATVPPSYYICPES